AGQSLDIPDDAALGVGGGEVEAVHRDVGILQGLQHGLAAVDGEQAGKEALSGQVFGAVGGTHSAVQVLDFHHDVVGQILQGEAQILAAEARRQHDLGTSVEQQFAAHGGVLGAGAEFVEVDLAARQHPDRKSTRLNSSHV